MRWAGSLGASPLGPPEAATAGGWGEANRATARKGKVRGREEYGPSLSEVDLFCGLCLHFWGSSPPLCVQPQADTGWVCAVGTELAALAVGAQLRGTVFNSASQGGGLPSKGCARDLPVRARERERERAAIEQRGLQSTPYSALAARHGSAAGGSVPPPAGNSLISVVLGRSTLTFLLQKHASSPESIPL